MSDLGFDLTVANLDDAIQGLRALLGERIFQRMLGAYDSAQARGLPDHVRRQSRAHPFALAWDDLIKGAQQSQREGALRLSEQAVMLLHTAHELSAAKGDAEFPNLLTRLVGRDQFFSTAFEASVYATYKALGFDVALVPEAANLGERRPDLVWRGSNGATLYLECKSLQDDVRVEERLWSDLEAQVGKLLTKSSRSISVRIEAYKRLASRDVSVLVGEVETLVRKFPLLPGAQVSGYSIALSEVLPLGETIALPIQLPRAEDERLWAETEIDLPNQVCRKISLVQVRAFADAEQSDRLVRLFRDAAAQLPHDTPGVAHLQVPYRASAHFLEVVDRARAELERELARRPHVCAIVISGRFLNKRAAVEGHGVDMYVAVLPNFASTMSLPDGFSLLGATTKEQALARVEDADMSNMPDGEFDVGPEGTYLIEFGINEPLGQQLGRYTFRYCSYDGGRQINVWQTYHNRFRIEVVHEDFGRRELNFDLNHLGVGVEHKMAFGWSAEGIRCFVDGADVLPSEDIS